MTLRTVVDVAICENQIIAYTTHGEWGTTAIEIKV
jgi:hypothetical protein